MTWFTTDTARIGILGLVLALLLPLGFPFVALAVVGLAVVALAFALFDQPPWVLQPPPPLPWFC